VFKDDWCIHTDSKNLIFNNIYRQIMSENDGKTIVPKIGDIYMKRKELCKKLYQSKLNFYQSKIIINT
jgi:hypothetical protein